MEPLRLPFPASNPSTPVNRYSQTAQSLASSSLEPSLARYRMFRFVEAGSSFTESCTCRLSSDKRRSCAC